jgi:3'-phosphoadenosine 5'-phosphosulfate sulfotransferase (PAPS reductase)/FAD synthetase
MNLTELKLLASVWKESQHYQTVLGKTLDEISDIVQEKAYASFSGGKDSVVMVHLLTQKWPNLPIFHWDYGKELMPRAYESESLKILKRIHPEGILTLKERPCQKNSREKPNETFFYLFLKDWTKKEDWKIGCVGLRKEESIRRKVRCQQVLEWSQSQGCSLYYPIRNWKWQDVWTYTITNDLPIHSHYLQRGPIEGWDKVRFVTFFDIQFEALGTSNVDAFFNWRFQAG